MSFWGGFVQGFSESVDKAIQKDIERTNEIVDDTVKIGINKYLENETEIKKEKAQIREEVNMLKALNFSLPKIASIVSAGQTANIIKLANKSTKDPDELWNGTTKFAEENGLTVNDVINKLVRTPKFSMGDIQVQSSGLLANLGLGQDLGTRIKTGIGTRVGGISKAVDTRDDIAIMPGGLTSEAKSLLTTSKETIDKKVIDAIEGLNISREEKDLMYIRIKAGGDISKIIGVLGGSTQFPKQGAEPDLKLMQSLAEKAIKNKDKKAYDQLKKMLLDLASRDKSKARAIAETLNLDKLNII